MFEECLLCDSSVPNPTFIFMIFPILSFHAEQHANAVFIDCLEDSPAVQPPRRGWFGDELDFSPDDGTV